MIIFNLILLTMSHQQNIVNKTKTIELSSDTSHTECTSDSCVLPFLYKTSYDCSDDPENTYFHSSFITQLPDYAVFYSTSIELTASINNDLYSPPATLITLNNMICVNKIVITISFGKELPTISTIQPSSGPIEGGTNVSVFSDNFVDSTENYYCFFGEYNSFFIKTDDTYGWCLSPEVESIGNYQFYIGLFDDTNAKSDILFTLYDIIITSYDVKYYSGSNVLMVFGEGFIDTGVIICKLCNEQSELYTLTGDFLDENTILCQINDVFDKLNHHDYNVSVSLNGVDYNEGNETLHISYIEDKDNKYLWIILVVVIGFIGILVFSITIIILLAIRKPNSNEITENISTSEITCEEIIGKGSFGDVWRASWRGQQIAVKLIPLEKVQKELMRSLRHPCVLQFFGSGMDKNFLLIAMELMTNGTVHDLLNNESLIISWVNKLRMLKRCCKPPVIHRDLKSFNLLVDDDWCVKVSDFGLSIPLQGESINSTNLCGTMAWIAPECFQNKPFGIKIDVYSYGVVMWEFLTREEPFADMAPLLL
ncbi:Serine-threonine protein kinase [Entamoeba marina]